MKLPLKYISRMKLFMLNNVTTTSANSTLPDIFEDYVSPVTAALNLLEEVVTKRKNMLNPLLIWAAQILGIHTLVHNRYILCQIKRDVITDFEILFWQ